MAERGPRRRAAGREKRVVTRRTARRRAESQSARRAGPLPLGAAPRRAPVPPEAVPRLTSPGAPRRRRMRAGSERCHPTLGARPGAGSLSSGRCRERLARPGDDPLSHPFKGSTLGAVRFHGRVRNGVGWGPHAVVTRSRQPSRGQRSESLPSGRDPRVR